MVDTLSAAQARRVALAAQGFGRARGTVGARQLNLAIQRLGLLQLDSVNAFERSHYLPLFARLGAYDKATLDRLTHGRRSAYTEYWAHEAAIIPLEHRPLWHWKMRRRDGRKNSLTTWGEHNPQMLDFLRRELATHGAMTPAQIEHDAHRRAGSWWGWSDVKTGLETLFMQGEVVTADRINFERSYVLAEQRIPAEILHREVSEDDARYELVRMASRALGVATLRDLADYYRQLQAPTLAAVQRLVDEGELLPVTVQGWDRPAWLHRDARLPRRIDAAAFLSPFDPVVWERERALRMFDFHYRIEIYTPADKRVFGYYSLPILIDDTLVGRIDLKNDRQTGVLRVQSAWREHGAEVDVDRVRGLLAQVAAWQGLDRIEYADRGDLIGTLNPRAPR